MEKKYIKPSIKVKKIEMENLLAANSPGGTTGLGQDEPGVGGDNDGTHPVSSKFNAWDTWEPDED